MSTITRFNGNASDLRAQVERELADLDRRIESDRGEIKAMLDNAESHNRQSLTVAEDTRAEALFRSIESARAARARKAHALVEARAIEDEENRLESRLNVTHRTALPTSNRTATVSVTRSERTYRPDTDPKGLGFVSDVIRAQVHSDPDASQKLSRHMQEERIERGMYEERAPGDVVSSGIGGIMVPQYLVDLTAPAVAARRPFADACTSHELPPDGMSFTIPKITGGTTTGIQTTELTAVSSTSVTEADLVIAVKTAAGSQNVSRQAADRSRLDEFVVSDLMARYATSLDNELINGATTGLDAVASGVAPSTVTFANVYPAILGRQALVEATLLGGKADLAVMHSRRWAWLSSQLTSTWPAVNQAGFAAQTSGVASVSHYGSGVRGQLPNGISVIVDNNVSTTKDTSSLCDRLYVVPSLEAHLWEAPGQPVMIRAEQPNAANLGILLVCFGYFAYTFSRYGSGAMGSLTTLTAPTF